MAPPHVGSSPPSAAPPSTSTSTSSTSTSSTSSTTTTATSDKPLTIGVFGGSFNPIHLGHALLAITTQQTKPVDAVVLVPVYKHAVKTDLLPFEDRVEMCRLAVAPFGNGTAIQVSTIERDVGASNGAMLRGLKATYPPGTKFQYICGDDFFRWMEKPKGMETLHEVDGLIVQRRLHKADADGNDDNDDERFFKEPMNESKIRAFCDGQHLEIDFIYGELPHFSSTLVRRAPGHWRSFLPQSVSKYLEARPHLLKQLLVNLEADAEKEVQSTMTMTTTTPTTTTLERTTLSSTTAASAASSSASRAAALCVMQGLEAVHTLQRERGRTGLYLSMGAGLEELQEAQTNTDDLLQEIIMVEETPPRNDGGTLDAYAYDEAAALAAELQVIPVWLTRDRTVMYKRCHGLAKTEGVEGWTSRLDLVQKFNPRIDVLIGATIRALVEILEVAQKRDGKGRSSVDRNVPELLSKWCEGKEALGRVRAFVSAGGPAAPSLVRSSLPMRERLNQVIVNKERSIERVLSLEAGMASSRLSAPDTLHRMLDTVTLWEWSLMGCFSSSTPLSLVHKLLSSDSSKQQSEARNNAASFDVETFFEASSSAIDFLLSFAKALAASACARA